jgi:large subunit ribosomal protein L23
MAIFSRKPSEDQAAQPQVEPAAEGKSNEQAAVPALEANAVVIGGRGNQSLVFPRLSEKSSALARLNKYVFKVEGKVNKIELRMALEQAYGVKIARINMTKVKGKPRRYGRASGKMSDFKKAIITLKPESKKIDLIGSA